MAAAPLTIGSRDSRLAVIQTEQTLARLGRLLPHTAFEAVYLSSPGDRDRTLDLRESPPDFFTADLDRALLDGRLDAALHSAKDVPDPVPEGLDWVWLPWREDPRDALVLAPGRALADLPTSPRLGISSDRRAAWCRTRFPDSQPLSIRGNIEDRLAQVDAGRYDGVVMAAAALIRLGLAARIAEWIPRAESAVPDGQGALALVFRAGDRRFLRLRSLFVRPVVFVGAGCGSAGLCTVAGVEALRHATVCLPDALIDRDLLGHLPREALVLDVGKRAGAHRLAQDDINRLLALHARRGERVVRLKGGDPGLFGRLGEEIDTLDALHLPYRVIPGVSSLQAASTGTGLLLTRRGVSNGFTVLTPRQAEDGAARIDAEARRALPLVFFMGVGLLRDIAAQLLADGLPPATPAAVVFDAGTADETVVRGTLAEPPAVPPGESRAGLILVGDCAARRFHPEWSALAGLRVLLPCSDALQAKAARAVRDFGGVPLPLPLIRTVLEPACLPRLKTVRGFDWLVVTSPSAVRLLLQGLAAAGLDPRSLPRLLAAGPGTADALGAAGLLADAVPKTDFGSAGVLRLAEASLPAGARVLRVRSREAGPALAEKLGALKLDVTDCVLYGHEALTPARIPPYDALFFASASAVDALAALESPAAWAGKPIVAMGGPTLAALENRGLRTGLTPPDPSVEGALLALAAHVVQTRWESP
jgi:uroporphyrinogen III methyltransferase/synthase